MKRKEKIKNNNPVNSVTPKKTKIKQRPKGRFLTIFFIVLIVLVSSAGYLVISSQLAIQNISQQLRESVN